MASAKVPAVHEPHADAARCGRACFDTYLDCDNGDGDNDSCDACWSACKDTCDAWVKQCLEDAYTDAEPFFLNATDEDRLTKALRGDNADLWQRWLVPWAGRRSVLHLGSGE